MKVAIIGGGAAGFFAAISCKAHHPLATVHILEKTRKTLGKVKISGGGRCNVTHDCPYVSELIKHYPRGGKKLKHVFSEFGTRDTISWFEQRGVEIKAESDGRMFPASDQSQSIIDALWTQIRKDKIDLIQSCNVSELTPKEDGFDLTIDNTFVYYDHVIIATGGHPKKEAYDWLRKLRIDIATPVPSLFTFNLPKDKITSLMGVVAHASVRIEGMKYNESGPLLITHWGMSGPAILKLSSWAARDLSNLNYQYNVLINWTPSISQESLKSVLSIEVNKKMKNNNPASLPQRLWSFLLSRSGVDPESSWLETPKKFKNKLIATLSNDIYKVSGKTTFKEEFVTCGGISLDQVNMKTMESRHIKGLYFAGEVLDIDAVTGGFNFQAAWSTGYVAGKLSQ